MKGPSWLHYQYLRDRSYWIPSETERCHNNFYKGAEILYRRLILNSYIRRLPKKLLIIKNHYGRLSSQYNCQSIGDFIFQNTQKTIDHFSGNIEFQENIEYPIRPSHPTLRHDVRIRTENGPANHRSAMSPRFDFNCTLPTARNFQPIT